MAEAAPRKDDAIPKGELDTLKRAHAPFNDTFSPEYQFEQGRNVGEGTSETRREIMKLFKERLVAQERAWATVRVALEKKIEQNPDTSLEELDTIVSSLSSPYGFSRRQRADARNLMRTYHERRGRMLELRKQMPDDKELVTKVTGFDLLPGDNVEVEMGPMQFNFTANPEFARRIKPDPETESDPTKSLSYAAFASLPYNNGLPYNVFVRPSEQHESTQVHELQHQKHAVYKERFEQEADRLEMARWIQEASAERDPGRRELLLTRYLEGMRDIALARAKDEIFAYSVDGTDVATIVDKFKPGDVLYDYLKPLREEFKSPAHPDLLQKVAVDGYARVIREGVASYKEVAHAVGVPQAIALLTDKRVRDWPKAAARILNAEKGRKKPLMPRDVLTLQEERDKAAVKKRLGIDRAKSLATVLAGGAAVYELGTLPWQGREAHEDLKNVERFETAQAMYRLIYASPLEPVNPRVLEGADALVLPIAGVTGQAAANVIGAEAQGASWRRNPETAYDKADKFITGAPMESRPEYQDIVTRAFANNTPIYVVDRMEQEPWPSRPELTQVVIGAEGIGGGVLLASAVDDLSGKPSRRGFLRGLAKAASGVYFGSAGRFMQSIDRSEPNLRSGAHIASEASRRVAEKLRPELQSAYNEARAMLIAQKSETLGAWLTTKLGHKPEVALVIDLDMEHIKNDLALPEEERMLALRKAFGPDFPIEGKITRVTQENGVTVPKEFRDTAFGA